MTKKGSSGPVGAVAAAQAIVANQSPKQLSQQANKQQAAKAQAQAQAQAKAQEAQAAAAAPAPAPISPQEAAKQKALEQQRQMMADLLKQQQERIAKEQQAAKQARDERLKAQEAQHAQPFTLKIGPAMFKPAAAPAPAPAKQQQQQKQAAPKQQQQQQQQQMKQMQMKKQQQKAAPAPAPAPAKAAPAAPAKAQAPAAKQQPQKPKKMAKVMIETHFNSAMFAEVSGWATKPQGPVKRSGKPTARQMRMQRIEGLKKKGESIHKQRQASKKAQKDWQTCCDGMSQLWGACPSWEAACKPVGGVKRAAQQQKPKSAGNQKKGGATR